MPALTVIYLILHFFCSINYTPYLWGVDSWAFFNPVIIAVMVVFVSLSLLSPVRIKVSDWLEKYIDFISKKSLFQWVIIILILFSIFQESVYFLGDGYLRIRNAQRGIFFSASEPLDTILHYLILKFQNLLFPQTAAKAIAYTSVLFGGIFFTVLLGYLKKLKYDNKKISVAIILFAIAGFTQLFYGYVESYTIVAALILIFLLTSIYALAQKKASITPAIYFALAVLCHSSSVVLPALIYVYYHSLKFENGKKKTFISGITIIIVFIAGIVSMGMLTHENPMSKYLQTMSGGGNLLPLFSNGTIYSIISLNHLIDIINELLLIFPIFLAIPLLTKYFKVYLKDKKYILILLVVAGYLFLLIAFKPNLGFARDWDLFSLIAIPLTLFVVLSILELHENIIYKFFPVIVISMIHTFSWIGLNSSESLSVDRMKQLVETPYWPNKSRSLFYDELAQYYDNKMNYKESIAINNKAYDCDKNPRYLYRSATLSMDLKDYISAEKYYLELTGTNYARAAVYNALGDIYYDTRQPYKAIEYYQNAYKYDTTNLSAVNNMGLLFLSLAKFEEAAKEFIISYNHFPNDARLNYYLCICEYNLKNYASSLNYLDKAEQAGYKKSIVDNLRKIILQQKNAKGN